jgi:hypothetical protein
MTASNSCWNGVGTVLQGCYSRVTVEIQCCHGGDTMVYIGKVIEQV